MATTILPPSPDLDRVSSAAAGRLRAYRLRLPNRDETVVLVVDDESGDPLAWTRQTEPLDSAAALGRLYRRLQKVADGGITVIDIDCLNSNDLEQADQRPHPRKLQSHPARPESRRPPLTLVAGGAL